MNSNITLYFSISPGLPTRRGTMVPPALYNLLSRKSYFCTDGICSFIKHPSDMPPIFNKSSTIAGTPSETNTHHQYAR